MKMKRLKNTPSRITRKIADEIIMLYAMLTNWGWDVNVSLEKRNKNKKGLDKVPLIIVTNTYYCWVCGYHYRRSKHGKFIPLNFQKKEVVKFFRDRKNYY